MVFKHSFLDATVMRRSTITLKKESPVSNASIISSDEHSILHTPSAFHVQSARAVILLGFEHDKFWDIALSAAEKATSPELFKARVSNNVAAFRKAFGTVLFFEDSDAVGNVPPFLGNYIKTFPEWGQHLNGIAQFIVWTALCSEGLGCSLQLYQKFIGPALNETLGPPAAWKCEAQLVFGSPDGPPRRGMNKEFADMEPRIRIFEAEDSASSRRRSREEVRRVEERSQSMGRVERAGRWKNADVSGRYAFFVFARIKGYISCFWTVFKRDVHAVARNEDPNDAATRGDLPPPTHPFFNSSDGLRPDT